jgi:hypothetical protein
VEIIGNVSGGVSRRWWTVAVSHLIPPSSRHGSDKGGESGIEVLMEAS